MAVRVCPKRDASCPHGINCPYVIDRYICREEAPMTDISKDIEEAWRNLNEGG
jgi:hypothetical protein